MSAAAVQARRQAVAQASRTQEAPSGVTIEGRSPNNQSLPLPPPSAPPSSIPSERAGNQLEADDILIRMMNELGPAIKTARLQTPRRDMNKMMHAHQDKPHTLHEDTLALILRARREAPEKFDIGKVCAQHELKAETLAKVLEVIEVPRIIERQGQKYGYW